MVSTDASATVIRSMREAAAQRGCTAVTWEVADAMALPFADASFDAVIEKGVLDCFMARAARASRHAPLTHAALRPQVDNKDPWNPDPAVRARVATVLRECHRVLSPAGCLLSITFAAPLLRGPLLADGAFTWRCRHDVFGTDWHYYFYTLRKGLKRADEREEPPAAEPQAPRESMAHEHMDDPDCLLHALLDE